MIDHRVEPDHPMVSLLTLPERIFVECLGVAQRFYPFADRWGVARSERTHAGETLERLVSMGVVIIVDKERPEARLTGEGAWLFRTLVRRSERNGLSKPSHRTVLQEAARGEAHG